MPSHIKAPRKPRAARTQRPPDKLSSLTVRLRGELLNNLDAAATQTGWGIGREVEMRLQRDFDIERLFGDRLFAKIIGIGFGFFTAASLTMGARDLSWLKDSIAAQDGIAGAVRAMLMQFSNEIGYSKEAETRLRDLFNQLLTNWAIRETDPRKPRPGSRTRSTNC